MLFRPEYCENHFKLKVVGGGGWWPTAGGGFEWTQKNYGESTWYSKTLALYQQTLQACFLQQTPKLKI